MGEGNNFTNFQQDEDIDDLNEDDEIEELFLDDNNSNRSDSSSTSSNNSISTSSTSSSAAPIIKIKKSKKKHGHKIMILEDSNMSDALNHLQIEVDDDDENDSLKSHVLINNHHKLSLPPSSNSIEDEDDDEYQENDPSSNFIMSDQLKQTLKNYKNYDEYVLSKVSNEQNNNLQLILWQPPPVIPLDDENDPTSESLFTSTKPIIPSTTKVIPSNITDDSNQLNYYTVEEPIEYTKSQKSHLKRSFSQVSKISIEELKHLNNISNTSQQVNASNHHFMNVPSNHQVQFYLVDEMDDQKLHNLDQSKTVYNQTAVNNLNIRDVTVDDNQINHAHPGSCEKMDIF